MLSDMLRYASVVGFLLSTAAAHQNFHQLWVNGVSPGYQVGIRMPPSNSPVVRTTCLPTLPYLTELPLIRRITYMTHTRPIYGVPISPVMSTATRSLRA